MGEREKDLMNELLTQITKFLSKDLLSKRERGRKTEEKERKKNREKEGKKNREKES